MGEVWLRADAAAMSDAHAKSMREFRSISSLEDSDSGYFTHGSPQKKSCGTVSVSSTPGLLPLAADRHNSNQEQLSFRLAAGRNNISASPTAQTTLHKGCAPRG